MKWGGGLIRERLAREIEIYALLIVCAIWFFLNLEGALGPDEVAKTGGTMFLLYGGPVANLEHPPLAKLFIGIGYLVFGRSSIGWRVVTPFFALGTIYLTYRTGVLLKNRTVGFAAAVALASTHLFASHSVVALLDAYLAFFSILLLFLLLYYFSKYDDISTKEERLCVLGIGAAASGVLLSKFYGIFFIAPAYLLLLWRWVAERKLKKEDTEKSILTRHKFLLLGFGIVALLAYLPMLLRIGDVLQSAGESQGYISEVLGGHRIIVAGMVYEIAPVWSYLYWLWEYGGWLYLLGLSAAILVLVLGLMRRNLGWESRVMVLMGLVPLLCLSLFTVKFPRYLIPLFPILGLFAALAIWRVIEYLLREVTGRTKRSLSERSSTILTTCITLSVLLVPFSPIYTTIQNPQINTDTGYDVAADMVSEYAEDNSDRTILVYSWYAGILKYYLEDSWPANLEVENLVFFSDDILNQLENGSVDLVIDLGNQPRFDETPTYILIHENYTQRQRVKDDLYVYHMK